MKYQDRTRKTVTRWSVFGPSWTVRRSLILDLVYEADYIRAKYRKAYIDSPVSCLNTLPLGNGGNEIIPEGMKKITY